MDWSARDREMSQAARALVAQWREAGVTVKVTAASVGRAMGAHSVVMANKDRLPELWMVIRSSQTADL